MSGALGEACLSCSCGPVGPVVSILCAAGLSSLTVTTSLSSADPNTPAHIFTSLDQLHDGQLAKKSAQPNQTNAESHSLVRSRSFCLDFQRLPQLKNVRLVIACCETCLCCVQYNVLCNCLGQLALMVSTHSWLVHTPG